MRFVKSLAALLTSAAAIGLTAGWAAAQSDYPAHPIIMIVPFPAGGASDVIARVVGEHLSRTLGQPIIVENVGGAGGTIGSTRAMRASPDGYTIVLGNMGTHGSSVAAYPNLAYKPDVDFAPIGLAAGTPMLIVARKDFPPKDLQQFISYVRTHADKLNVSHAGVGSTMFSTCLLLHSTLDVKPTMVAFTGVGAVNALVAGHVDYACDIVVNSVPQIQAGTIKAYAIAADERSPILPNVPTSKEAGLPEFRVSAWNGFFAPRGTPQQLLDTLTAALDKALDDGRTRDRLLELGCEIPDKIKRGQQPLAELVKSEIARWAPIIKAAGAKAQ
ncbi:MAG: tripartite tricarboxylate transporter substrate-binding protein [Hyphomicrobiaceae bacterium]